MLNACPKCQRSFDAEQGNFCPEDATKLLPIEQVPVAKDPSDPFVGHAVAGRYEIRRVIADGGMGRVYEGRQLDAERRIAVKILHQNIAEDPVNIERFKREADTSRALDHTHIVDVFDFDQEKPAPGRAEGAWFLVMEYLDGEELRTCLTREKTVPIARVVRIVSQAAIALDGAHEQGAVHRDLKPDNIFLVRKPDGDHVKLLDFGSVKFTKGQDKGQKLTVMGTTIGSPFYMSPEQARGLADLDRRADVWALGAMIYEMTVGVVPFTAPNGPQILFKILGEEPMPPSMASDNAPPELDDFMMKALAKKRENRFQSCGELADALGHAFGLPGSHLEWARTPEKELASRLGRAPAPPPVVLPGGGAQPVQPAPRQHPLPPHTYSMGQDTAGGGVADEYVPIKKVPVALYAGIAGAIALLVLVAVLALK